MPVRMSLLVLLVLAAGWAAIGAGAILYAMNAAPFPGSLDLDSFIGRPERDFIATCGEPTAVQVQGGNDGVEIHVLEYSDPFRWSIGYVRVTDDVVAEVEVDW
jgi:hypothetical protein